MFEGLTGRLVNGAVWGLGAGLVLTVLGRDSAGGGAGARPIVRGLMRAYVVASDRVRELTAEAREGLDDLYTEVQAERRTAQPGASAPARRSRRRRTRPATAAAAE